VGTAPAAGAVPTIPTVAIGTLAAAGTHCVEAEGSEQEKEQEELALRDRNGKNAKPKISGMHWCTFSRKSLKPLAHN